MLNEMRFGRLTSASINKFKSLSREIIYDDGMGATELYVAFHNTTVVLLEHSFTAFRVVKMSIGQT